MKIINRAEYKEAYNYAQKVYVKQMRPTDARIHLKKFGLNPGSALDFVYIFKQLLRGEVYKRAMSVEATEDFISWIHRDYDETAFRNSLSALRKHIDYHGGPMRGHNAILKKYENVLTNASKTRTALDDLDTPPTGSSSPDRAKRTSYVIERDEHVRAYVLKRAKGKCEHCGCEGFRLLNGQRYVEAHHIIALAKSGADTIHNVIALCANHHREAHYGEDAERLEAKFIARLLELNK